MAETDEEKEPRVTSVWLHFNVTGPVTPKQAVDACEQFLREYQVVEPEKEIEFKRSYNDEVTITVDYQQATAVLMKGDEEDEDIVDP